MAGLLGFEPRNDGTKTRCLTAWRQPNIHNNHNQGWWRGADSNCRTRWERIYSPPRLATSLPLHSVNSHNLFIQKIKKWCRPEELNPQPTDYKSVALPIELDRHEYICIHKNGGGCRA